MVKLDLVFTNILTHWGQVTHIYVSKLAIVGSDNGLLPGQHKTIIGANPGILLIPTLGTNFSEIFILSFKNMHMKMSSGKWQPFCLSPYVLYIPDRWMGIIIYNMFSDTSFLIIYY